MASWFPENKQVLRFVEPTTNVTVMLIGSMHYNPASISLVEKTVENLGETNKLGSVVIESCDIRWNKTQEMMDKKEQSRVASTTTNATIAKNDQDFLGNEMRAAWEVATRYHRPTVLGDQRINITVDALKASLKDTAGDVFLKGPSGWERSKNEIATNWKKTIPIAGGASNDANIYDSNIDSGYLNAWAFFDPRLLISLPVSLVKYPLSFLIKDPVPVGTVFAVIAALNYYADGSSSLTDALFGPLVEVFSPEAITENSYSIPWTDYLLSLLVAFLETVVFARLLLKPLLADRNEILARSVLDQCLLFSKGATAEVAAAAPVVTPPVTTEATVSDETADDDPWMRTTPSGRFVVGSWFQKLSAPPVGPVSVPGGSDRVEISSSDDDGGDDGGGATDSGLLPEIDPSIAERVIYVPGSDPASMEAVQPGTPHNDKVVVAVLGMAHCNGVMKLLKEQRV